MDASTTIDNVTKLAEILAIGGSAIWAAWTFQKLQSVRAAEATIKRDILEADKSSAEISETERRLVSQQPNLEISFEDVSEYHLPEAAVWCLVASVTLRNSGVRNLVTWFDNASMSAGRVESKTVKQMKLLDVQRFPAAFLPSSGSDFEPVSERIFRVGQARHMTFLVPIARAGAYFLQFAAAYSATPFEGERESTPRPLAIYAVEQHVVAVDGRRAGGDGPASV